MTFLSRPKAFWDRRIRHFDPAFDADFYATHYPDLRRLKSRRNLYQHYLCHGRDEGRYINLGLARDDLARRGHVLPVDFSSDAYRKLNPDLQRFYEVSWQYELHFLQYGQAEGRPYAAYNQNGRPVRGWASAFNLYDFLLYSEAWRPSNVVDLEAALVLFFDEGIPRLTPLAKGLAFDPAFYRQTYDLGLEDPVDLYRDWLFRGFDIGFAPNEDRAIFQYVGDRAYPQAFDWLGFAQVESNETKIYPAKVDALGTLFAHPLEKWALQHIKGPAAGSLFQAIGDYHLVRGSFEVAVAVYERAIGFPAIKATVLLRQGDALRSLGRFGEAISAYKATLSLPGHSVWSVVHAAALSIEIGDSSAAFQLLREACGQWAGDPAYRNAVDDSIEQRFRQISDATRTLVKSGDLAAADRYADQELDRLTTIIEEFKIPAGTVSILPNMQRVVMLACLDLPQCTHYRVAQKVEQLARLGMTLEVFDFNDPVKFMSALPGAHAAIFYRVPSYPRIIESILYARSLGITTFYDIDDLLFTRDFPDSFESYEGQISIDVYVGLQHGVPLYKRAISLCDIGLASTTCLADYLKLFVRSKRTYVIANGLDSTNEFELHLGKHAKPFRKSVSIFYGSGTKAHNRDFNLVVAPSLYQLMLCHKDLRLVIVGFLTLDLKFEEFGDRVSRFDFMENRTKYITLLASCDINISVLSPSPLASCKSEIKWLEAAVLQIPSIVSRTSTFEQVLDAPHDGLMAETQAEWFGQLDSLVRNSTRRQEIGSAARAKALRLYSLSKLSDDLGAALVTPAFTQLSRPAAFSKPRVLICNVFFPPQSRGGATRVVESNVNFFIAHCKADFDVFVLCADEGAPESRLTIDTYRGCTVLRLGTPAELNMDWRPFNSNNAVAFNKVLDLVQPDLIHFHCIQRLTASIVEVALKREIPYLVSLHDAWWISDFQFLVDQNDCVVDPSSDIFATRLPRGVARLESLDRSARLRNLLASARLLLPVSDAFGALFKRLGFDVEVVANGISRLPASLNGQRQPDKIVLGHFGGRSAHKGGSLIELVLKENCYENLKLVMLDGSISGGDTIYTHWGKTEVELIGEYPQSRINELFDRIDVLLAPSIWPESFGLISREALFYNKWVIASDIGAMAECIREGINGFKIRPNVKVDLADILGKMNSAIEEFKSPPPFRFELRSADEQAKEIAKIYVDIIRNQGSETGPCDEARRRRAPLLELAAL